MRRLTLDHKGAIGGAILAAVGAFMLAESFQYGIGTARRMGAGYFPMVLGGIGIAIGVLMVLRSLARQGTVQPIAWRPAVAILAAIAVFGLTVRQVGLLPSIALTGLLACLGDSEIGRREAIALVLSICFGVWLVFVVGLQLPIPAFRMPF